MIRNVIRLFASTKRLRRSGKNAMEIPARNRYRGICDELGVDREKDPDAGLDLVALALNRLARARLLSESSRQGLQAPRYSRRELARRLVFIGGVALVPMIFAINAKAVVVAATCVSVCNSLTVGRCCCSNRRICTSTGCNGAKC